MALPVASLLLHPFLCRLVRWVGGTLFALFSQNRLKWRTLTCPGLLRDWPYGKERPVRGGMPLLNDLLL